MVTALFPNPWISDPIVPLIPSLIDVPAAPLAASHDVPHGLALTSPFCGYTPLLDLVSSSRKLPKSFSACFVRLIRDRTIGAVHT